MRYEQKAELQDSNKARMYEEKKKQNKWDKLETQIWRVVLFKEDKKGNQKFLFFLCCFFVSNKLFNVAR